MTDHPILLSQAHVTNLEVEAVTRAVRGGWVAPLGPEVDAFEAELAAYTRTPHAVALSSGTAALQLGLKALGVQPGDEVIVPTLTFAATAFAVVHTGAVPVFLDAEGVSWNLDPALLERTLGDKTAGGRLPAAVVPVDLFGRTADYDGILPICRRFGVPVLVDAAESLGARHHDASAGSMGAAAVFSFNGNKIMTTSGGGMLVSHDQSLVEKVRFWSTQSREPYPWYEHEEIGFNYRMSNILAALGRAQLQRLSEMIARRREIRAMYTELFAGVAGLTVKGDPPWGTGNDWLTCVEFDPELHADTSTRVREGLAGQAIEARPVWKPMHRQPVFRNAESHLTGTADAVFARGLCLPSGVGLSDVDVRRVAEAVRAAL